MVQLRRELGLVGEHGDELLVIRQVGQDLLDRDDLLESLDPRPLGRGWRVLIYPPGTNSALSECDSDLEKGSKEAVIKEAKKIVDAHLDRKLSTP